jgi:nicotinamide riboside kinase
MASAFVVALLGAESTGKTTLAAQLRDALAAQGHRVAVVWEYLREFCVEADRTPHKEEQAGIAAEQMRRIDAARRDHDIVIADTTALMVAVYSELVFADPTLYAAAAAAQREVNLTLLTALDIPWQPDGLQREGPHVQGPVDALLRAALQRERLAYSVVAGSGPQRLESALQAVRHAMRSPSQADEAAGNPKWQWVCERCGDVDCERHLLPRARHPRESGDPREQR